MDIKNGCGMKLMCFSAVRECCWFTARAWCPTSIFCSFSELCLQAIPSAKLKVIKKIKHFAPAEAQGVYMLEWSPAEKYSIILQFSVSHPSLTASPLPPVT